MGHILIFEYLMFVTKCHNKVNYINVWVLDYSKINILGEVKIGFQQLCSNNGIFCVVVPKYIVNTLENTYDMYTYLK